MVEFRPRASIRRAGCMALLLAVILVGAPALARADDAGDQAAVVGALNASAAAWSKGDLDSFMRSYEASPQTAYVGRGKLVTGTAAIRTMYAAHFGEGPQSMGRLSFTVLDFRPLGAGYALLTGQFFLQQSKARSSGIFTLVFHKSATGWGIISDHTSS